MKTAHKEDCRMAFGRKDKSCPRCLELLNGSAPRAGWGDAQKRFDSMRIAAIASHNCAERNCGPVCVAFDW